MVKKSDFKEIFLKLATNGQSDKKFLLTTKFCSQGVVCPCPGAIYMYKSIKIYTRTRCQVSVYRTTAPLVMIVQSMKMHRAQKGTSKALNYHVGALAYLCLCSWLGPDDLSLVGPPGFNCWTSLAPAFQS